jgi:hypothetical protein
MERARALRCNSSMMPVGRVRVAFALAVAVVLLCVPVDRADAAIWLRYFPVGGPPGTRVEARTLDASMSLIATGRLPLFLAPADVADSIKSPTDERLVPIGELVADKAHVGHLVFVVPELRPGAYMTVAHCKPCGGSIFTVGPFTVTPRLPARCAVAPTQARVAAVVRAFNVGDAKAFLRNFERPARFHPYSFRIAGTGLTGREEISRFIAQRHAAGDHWAVTTLAPPSAGASGGRAIYGVGVGVTQHGRAARGGGGKVIISCTSGLVRFWLGPAYGPPDVHWPLR